MEHEQKQVSLFWAEDFETPMCLTCLSPAQFCHDLMGRDWEAAEPHMEGARVPQFPQQGRLPAHPSARLGLCVSKNKSAPREHPTF